MSNESGGFFGSDSADVGLEDHYNSGIQGNGMSDLMTLEEIQAFPITAKAHIDGLQKHNNTLLDQKVRYIHAQVDEMDELKSHIARLEKVVDAAKRLAYIKRHKDKFGKNGWYQQNQPLAWDKLDESLNELKGVGK